jgi:hypothetical protein
MKLKKIYSETIHEVEKNIFQNYFRNRMTEKYIPKLFQKQNDRKIYSKTIHEVEKNIFQNYS